MSPTIQRLVIRGLHHARDYNIEIRDNKIIMVGVNSLGKTTVVNLLYLILSRQWERALEYDFDQIEISINEDEYQLKQEKDESSHVFIAKKLRSVIRRSIPTSMYNVIPPDAFDRLAVTAQEGGREALTAELDRLLPLSSSQCRRLAGEIHLEPKSFNKSMLSQLNSSPGERL